MIVVFPYKTDAAIDHKPWGTLALIGANVAVAVLLGFPSADMQGDPWVNTWVLKFGQFNPLTWVTSAFTHLDYFHLLFNMIFLWAFGLVVEGAIGWRRFLPVYLAIAIGQNAVEQVLLLGADKGGSVGASAAISGLMAIAAVWAPRNHLTVFCWIITIMRRLEIRVFVFCAVWLGIDVFWFVLSGFSVSSEMLHLMGAGIGLGIGVGMLKNKLVDCEGWDYFSLREKGPPRGRAPLSEPLLEKPAADPRVDALAGVRDALAAGDGASADDCYERGQRALPDWVLPGEEFTRLIEVLLAAGHEERVVVRLEEFLRHYPDDSGVMRLRLADQLVRRRRPTRALGVLESIPGADLTPEQEAYRVQIEERARAARERGELELE